MLVLKYEPRAREIVGLLTIAALVCACTQTEGTSDDYSDTTSASTGELNCALTNNSMGEPPHCEMDWARAGLMRLDPGPNAVADWDRDPAADQVRGGKICAHARNCVPGASLSPISIGYGYQLNWYTTGGNPGYWNTAEHSVIVAEDGTKCAAAPDFSRWHVADIDHNLNGTATPVHRHIWECYRADGFLTAVGAAAFVAGSAAVSLWAISAAGGFWFYVMEGSTAGAAVKFFIDNADLVKNVHNNMSSLYELLTGKPEGFYGHYRDLEHKFAEAVLGAAAAARQDPSFALNAQERIVLTSIATEATNVGSDKSRPIATIARSLAAR